MTTHKLPFIRTPYNYDTDPVSKENGLKCDDKTRTQQQFKDETDINTILERFNVTGLLPTKSLPPQFGDFTGVTDYHTAMTAVAEAGEAFDALPAYIRARFHNDPEQLINFLENEDNRQEAEKLGLVPAKPVSTLAPTVPPPPLSTTTSSPLPTQSVTELTQSPTKK